MSGGIAQGAIVQGRINLGAIVLGGNCLGGGGGGFSGGELCLHLHFSLDFAAGICIAYFSPFVDRAIVKRSGLMLVSISRREVGAF